MTEIIEAARLNKGNTVMTDKSKMMILAGTMIACCMISTPELAAAGVDDLPKVVARVNGKKVASSAVAPADGETIAAAVRRAVDEELVSQQFEKEGLDKDTNYQKQISQVRLQSARTATVEISMLANHYRQATPELTVIPDPTQVTEAEIDAWLQGDTSILGKLKGEKARDATRNFVAQETANRVHSEAIKARLAKSKLKFNGVRIPQSVIDAGVDAKVIQRIGLRPKQTTPIRNMITETVIAKEAKQRGVAPNVIAADTKLVKELVDAVVIEGAGQPCVVGNYSSGFFKLAGALNDIGLATKARKKGLDKDPSYLKRIQSVRAKINTEGYQTALRANIYYSKHGLASAIVTDEEIKECYEAVIRALVDNKRDGKQNYLRSYLQAAKLKALKKKNAGIAKVDISDAELDAWYLAVMPSILNRDHGSLRNVLQTAKLQWLREGILEGLRKAAKIEYLADVE